MDAEIIAVLIELKGFLKPLYTLIGNPDKHGHKG